MRNLFFFFSFLSIFIHTPAQAQNSQIIISNPVCPDGISLSFGCPVDDNPSHFINMADSFIFKDGAAVKTFAWSQPVFIMITGNQYCPKKRIILCPGDTVRIHIFPKGELSFEGSNAAGLQEYNEGNAMINGYVPIGDNILTLKKKDNIISALEKLKENIFRPMVKLHENRKISDAFFDYVKKEADQVFVWAVRSKIYAAKYLTEEERDEIKIYFIQKYPPFGEAYRGTNAKSYNQDGFASLVEKGMLPKTDYFFTGFWDDKESFHNFLPLEAQEQRYANKLQILHSIMGMMTDEQFKAGIEKLKKISPNSIYLPALLKMTGDNMNPDHALGVFSNDNINGLIKIGKFESMDLEAMIKKYFKGTPVLVDLWATYCSPCKKEFQYKEELHEFLKTNGIKLLYCSVDYATNSRKWAEDVVDYQLYGIHYFITDQSSGSLQKLIGEFITIPRYLLFDGLGNLVSGRLPRPSSKETMYKEIVKLLDKSAM